MSGRTGGAVLASSAVVDRVAGLKSFVSCQARGCFTEAQLIDHEHPSADSRALQPRVSGREWEAGGHG